MLRRAPISSQEPLQQQTTDSSRHLAAAPARQVYAGAIGIRTIPGTSRPWRWHTGDRKNRHGAMLAKLPPPFMPLTIVAPCALDITCYPPQPTPAPQAVGARWQQIESVRLIFRSDCMADILRAPPIPWRANLGDFCHSDNVRFVHYPYPIPEPGQAQTCCRDDSHHDTPCGISASFGGLTYERTIMLGRERDGEGIYMMWEVLLAITSRYGEWLASLSRADAAALVSLDSVAG